MKTHFPQFPPPETLPVELVEHWMAAPEPYHLLTRVSEDEVLTRVLNHLQQARKQEQTIRASEKMNILEPVKDHKKTNSTDYYTKYRAAVAASKQERNDIHFTS